MSPATIAHCWIKAQMLCAAHTAELKQLHGEYRAGFRSVADHVTAALEMMQGCTLGDSVFAQTRDVDERAGMMSWFDAEESPEIMIRTAELDEGDSGDDEEEALLSSESE